MTRFQSTARARTRVKICGIATPADAHAAVVAGADAIGLVFYPDSSRNISIEAAAEIVLTLPAFISSVALFVDPDPELVREIEEVVKPNLLQLHGNESEGFASQFDTPYIKALRVAPHNADELEASINKYPSAKAILLDAWVEGVAGGTGETFDWGLVPESVRSKIILAGGLTPENVTTAVEQIRPFAVDVSGGVESAPGQKDADKITRFIQQVGAAQIPTSDGPRYD